MPCIILKLSLKNKISEIITIKTNPPQPKKSENTTCIYGIDGFSPMPMN